MSARVRSLLAACPSWRTRFSAPRMHLLAPRALGARKVEISLSKLHALATAYDDPSRTEMLRLRGVLLTILRLLGLMRARLLSILAV